MICRNFARSCHNSRNRGREEVGQSAHVDTLGIVFVRKSDIYLLILAGFCFVEAVNMQKGIFVTRFAAVQERLEVHYTF